MKNTREEYMKYFTCETINSLARKHYHPNILDIDYKRTIEHMLELADNPRTTSKQHKLVNNILSLSTLLLSIHKENLGKKIFPELKDEYYKNILNIWGQIYDDLLDTECFVTHWLF